MGQENFFQSNSSDFSLINEEEQPNLKFNPGRRLFSLFEKIDWSAFYRDSNPSGYIQMVEYLQVFLTPYIRRNPEVRSVLKKIDEIYKIEMEDPRIQKNPQAVTELLLSYSDDKMRILMLLIDQAGFMGFSTIPDVVISPRRIEEEKEKENVDIIQKILQNNGVTVSRGIILSQLKERYHATKPKDPIS